MLTPEQIDALSLEISRCYADIEVELIRKVCRSVFYGKGTSNVNSWRLTKLQQMGKVDNDLRALISRESRKTISKVDEAISKALERAAANDDIVFNAALKAGKISVFTPTSQTGVFDRYRTAMLKNAREVMNLTNTTALQIAKREYQDAINYAYVKVQTGTAAIGDAVQEACHKLGGSGLRVDYISDKGKHTTYSLDASIRRDIATSVVQTAAKVTEGTCADLDTDLVITTTHGGARPEHEVWQGKVFSLSGKSKKHPSLVAATDYGSVTGLCGANCRHSFYPWFEGIDDPMKQRQSSDDTRKENEERYNQSQEQRKLERDIRNWKRQVAADEAGAPDYAGGSRTKLNDAQQKMRDFIDESGRKRRYDREQV
jgi:hypothetical protein